VKDFCKAKVTPSRPEWQAAAEALLLVVERGGHYF
jgi:hypothetical protein